MGGLGWTLFRVWSTDWWTHRAGALEKLDSALVAHLEADRNRRKEDSRKIEEEEAPEVDVQEDWLEGSNEEPVLSNEAENSGDAAGFALIEDKPETVGGSEFCYNMTQFDQRCHKPDPESFYSDEYESHLSLMVDQVINTEGPIHEDVLVRRIARHHGFQRAGRQIRDVVIKIAKHRHVPSQEDVGLFFWPSGMEKACSVLARYKNRDDEMRNVDYICAEEIRAINRLHSLGGDPAELARSIGIARVAQSTRNRLNCVLNEE